MFSDFVTSEPRKQTGDPFSYMGLFMCRGEGRGKRFSVGSDEKIDF